MSTPTISNDPAYRGRALSAITRQNFLRLMKKRRRVRNDADTLAILQAQQEATVDGILVVDHKGRILTYNQRYQEIWGFSHELVSQRREVA
jgi:PAS domain-containing protein